MIAAAILLIAAAEIVPVPPPSPLIPLNVTFTCRLVNELGQLSGRLDGMVRTIPRKYMGSESTVALASDSLDVPAITATDRVRDIAVIPDNTGREVVVQDARQPGTQRTYFLRVNPAFGLNGTVTIQYLTSTAGSRFVAAGVCKLSAIRTVQ